MSTPVNTNVVRLSLCVLACGASQAWGLGEEHFGNRTLNELNYNKWPGIVLLVNDPSRVYHVWVNGNEKFFYRGDLAASTTP